MIVIKKLLLLILLFPLVAACQEDTETPQNNVSSIQVIGANGSMTRTENRVVITLRDGYEYVNDVKAVKVKAQDIQMEGDPTVWEGSATGYTDYEVPYWVFYPEIPRSGSWLFALEIERENGKKETATFGTNFWDAPLGLTAGQPAIASETRTATTEEEIKAISSDTTPNLAFYEQTIADALGNGKPTLIAFTTPGFCTSQLCSPVMNTFDALYEQYQGDFNFIHVEVHSDFETLAYVPAMEEWGLVNEPWIYVIDQDGMIAARYDGPVSVTEITPAIEGVLDAS